VQKCLNSPWPRPKIPLAVTIRHPRREAQLTVLTRGQILYGYCGHCCYLPLYIFCGEHVLCARLRESNIDAAAGSVEELQRIVEQLCTRWPATEILIRGIRASTARRSWPGVKPMGSVMCWGWRRTHV
jgi:hypothetical protein